MTANGSGYLSKAFRSAIQRLGARHIRTRPYTPRTNGKAERYIQTCKREWAYVRAYPLLTRSNRSPVCLHSASTTATAVTGVSAGSPSSSPSPNS